MTSLGLNNWGQVAKLFEGENDRVKLFTLLCGDENNLSFYLHVGIEVPSPYDLSC